MDNMSLKIVIAMFVSCMAPLFLVYVVVNGTHMLQIDDVTYIDKKTQYRARLAFLSSVILCVVAYGVMLICATMCGGKTRAEQEHARHKAVVKDLRQRDEGGMEWLDIDPLKDDSKVGEEDEKRFHFFDVDDEIGDVSLESGSREDTIGKGSLESASGLG